MRLFIRIVSGFFMVAIGIGFCLDVRKLDSTPIQIFLVALGIGALVLGVWVLVRNPRKDRSPQSDTIEDEKKKRPPKPEGDYR